MTSNFQHGYFIVTSEPHKSRLVFTISNFIIYKKSVGTFIRSPLFTCTKGKQYGMNFYLKIYPRGKCEKSEDFVSVLLRMDTLPNILNDITVSINLSLIDFLQNKVKLEEKTANNIKFKCLKNTFGWEKYINREELLRNERVWLPDGHLTLECNAEVHFDFKNPVSTTIVQSENLGLNPANLADEIINKVYQDKIWPDVKLKASDGRVFDAHKCVLSVRSPYFNAMFQHRMKENEKNMVDLSKEMNSEELESLLQFIYLGTLPNIESEIARKMFQIGDMQGIVGLMKLSEQTLIELLNDDNALEMLVFASQHDAKELRKAAALRIANFDK